MRLRLAHARWCTAFIVIIVVNVHVSLWVRRVHETTLSSSSHPLYSDLERQLIIRTGSNSSAQDLGRDIHDNAVSDKKLSGPTLEITNFTSHFDISAGISAQRLSPAASIDALKSTLSGVIYGTPTRLSEEVARRRKKPAEYALQKTELPSFATDESEYILSSMIERSSSSANLFLTTFMLCHHILEPSIDSLNIHRVHPIMKETWRRAVTKFRTTQYHPSGSRIQMANEEIFRCKIRHSLGSKPYTVMGMFMPNRLTADPAANRLLDILRCPLMESQAAYRSFANSNGSIYTEIIRGNATIASFAVPWKSRQTGFLLSHSRAATTVDAWRGHELTMDDRSSVVQAIDKLHICIPFSSREPTRSTLPMYLEFVSHHLLLGASHINLPLPFGWNSKAMNSFTEIFQSYIDEGMLANQTRPPPTITTKFLDVALKENYIGNRQADFNVIEWRWNRSCPFRLRIVV